MSVKKIKVALRDVDFRMDEEEPTLREWQGWEAGDVIDAEIGAGGAVLGIATHDSEHCKKGDYAALHECEFKIVEG